MKLILIAAAVLCALTVGLSGASGNPIHRLSFDPSHSRHVKAEVIFLHSITPIQSGKILDPVALADKAILLTTLMDQTPGRHLEQTFTFTPDAGCPCGMAGQTSFEVNDDGNTYAMDRIAMLNPSGAPGVMRGWWREPGTTAFAQPIILEDGLPAEISVHYP